MMSPELLAMVQWFEVYFSTFTEHDKIDPDNLKWLIQQRAQNASPESIALTMHLCDQLKQPVDEGTVKGVLENLYDLDFVGRVGAMLSAYDDGEDVDIVHMVSSLAQSVQRAKASGKAEDFIDKPLDTILSAMENDKGVKFRRIPMLQQGIRALQGGKSIAIGARPDKGKTSLIADILTDFAPQCVEFFGADRPILWLNNEGSGELILPRLRQAALHCTLEELFQWQKEGSLDKRYAAVIGSDDPHYIRVKDIHGTSLGHIEQVIEAMRPAVVVYDMLANVKMSVGTGNKADAVETAWQTVRELAVRYDHIALSTVQISDGGGNNLFPEYNWLKDSRTGIQGATDIILLLGSLDDPRVQEVRGISTPKNKSSVTGQKSYLKAQLVFDGSRCQFTQTEGNIYGSATNEGPSMGTQPAQVGRTVPVVSGTEDRRDSSALPGTGQPPVPIVRRQTPAQLGTVPPGRTVGDAAGAH